MSEQRHMIEADLHPDKREVQKQWDQDPCGAVTAEGEMPGTLEFYRAVRQHRYGVYAPWMDAAMRFDSWRGSRTLEIGVGVGSDHYRLASAGCEMTALDLSREHLRHTSRHLELEGLTTAPVYGDAEQMPFPDNSFDLVYSFGVLHHTPGTEQAISEVRRVLRPGGTALIGLYHRDSCFFWLNTLLQNGLLRGRLFTLGWRRLLSQIEYRSDPSAACPLVKVYSRRGARKLFRHFGEVTIQTHHIEAAHFSAARLLLSKVDRSVFERRLGRFGWYLIIRARKPR